jgi:hypothetical protein
MSDLKLKFAFWNYDRTQALVDGAVKIDGVDATFHSARIVSEIFERMIRQREFDVSELGMTYFCAPSTSTIRRSLPYQCSRTVVSGTRRSTSTQRVG